MRRNEAPSELSPPSVDDDSEQVAAMYGPPPKMEFEQLEATTEALVKSEEQVESDPAYVTLPRTPSTQRSATYTEEPERTQPSIPYTSRTSSMV